MPSSDDSGTEAALWDLAVALSAAFGADVATRFMGKVQPDPSSDCWVWLGGKGGNPRRRQPVFWLHGRSYYAARVVLRAVLGRPLRNDHLATHSCDRGNCCVAPHHLREATYSRNLRDAWERNRRTATTLT